MYIGYGVRVVGFRLCEVACVIHIIKRRRVICGFFFEMTLTPSQ